MLVDKQTYFENHHHQKKFYHENNLNQTLHVLQFYSCSAFNPAFVVNVASFVFESEFFKILEISGLLTNSFCFIFTSSLPVVNLL